MGENNKSLHRKRNIIATSAGVIVVNLLLAITLTNVTPDQAGTQSTHWREIFIGARPLSVLLYVLYLLSLFEKTANTGKRIVSFLSAHMNELLLCFLFLYLTLYEMYYAYFTVCYISYDSSRYMREAVSLMAGNGFYLDRLAGYDTWFSDWPIGYPALIALTATLSRHSIYLSSKLLSIALVGTGLLVLRMKFKKDAWIFSLIYLNIGFLTIYGYTWSENPFILCLIIWGVALSAIVEKETPEKRWYVVLALGILGAFFTRYFGIVGVLFTGLCLAAYMISYFAKGRNQHTLSKIKGLLCVEFVASAVICAYLLMNKIMSGYMTGTDRLEWKDDYDSLTSTLYNALIAEISNATRIDLPSFLPGNFDRLGQAAVLLVLALLLAAALFRNYRVNRRLDYKIVFIGAGIFYYVVFIIVRFYSYMDTFSYRFFAPAGMLVSIGVLGLIKDSFGEKLKLPQVAMCLFLIILCRGLTVKIEGCTISDSAYHIEYEQITGAVASIPSKGIIMYSDSIMYNASYKLYAFRPDIAGGLIAYDDSMGSLIDRYQDSSDSIWIQRSVLNEIVNDGNYSQELREALSQYVNEEADEEEYIQLY